MKTFYEQVSSEIPLRQGDILYPIPNPIISLKDLVVVEDEKLVTETWSNLSQKQENLIVVPVKTVWAIVASQDCDASRQEAISLFLIDEFSSITGQQLPEKVNKRIDFLKKASRLNASWFYLPSNGELFSKPMAIDFHTIIQVIREDLAEKLSDIRKARLNRIAYEHYRECIAQYFRRYPYNEWYPFSKEEFEEYRNRIEEPKEHEQITGYPWQS